MGIREQIALRWLVKRAGEKTTWAGVAGMAALIGINIDIDSLEPVINLFGSVAGLAAVLYPEK